MMSTAWLDGGPAESLPLTDRGLHYGDGLFETVAVKGGHIARLDMHLERLSDGCVRLGLPMPDVAMPSSLSARGRETFKTYLESGPNKAFVLSGSHFGWATGRRTVDEAVKDALGFCKPDPGAKCSVVNVNNKPAE